MSLVWLLTLMLLTKQHLSHSIDEGGNVGAGSYVLVYLPMLTFLASRSQSPAMQLESLPCT